MFEVVELLSKVNVNMLRLLSPIAKAKDITMSELFILWKINKKGPCRVTDIARETGMPASTMTGVFDRLEAQGYLERVHDSQDRRSVLVRGTPRLREMIESAVQRADDEIGSIFGGLPPGFVERLTQDLQDLQAHLSKKVADRKNDRPEKQ